MIKMDIEADIKRVEKFLTKLEREEVPKAASFGLNRAIKKTEGVAAKKISQSTGIKPQRKVREKLSIQKASWRRLEAAVVAGRRGAFNLIEFVAPSKRYPGAFRKRSGVIAKAWGKKKPYKKTFIVRGSHSGKPVVVSRKGGSRKKVKTIYGPNIPSELSKRELQDALDQEGRPVFRKNFFRDLRRRIKKLQAGS